MERTDQQPQQPTPQPSEPGYDHTKASWYSKTYDQMTDAEVDEARAYDIFVGSTSMDEEWLRRRASDCRALPRPAVTA